MNPEYSLNAELIGQQYLQDKDLRRHLPRYPKLIPELLFLPYKKGFLVVGGRTSRLISCPQGRAELQKIIAMIDGTKTIEELELSSQVKIEGGVFGVISLLYRYGFLEEAWPESERPTSQITKAIDSYCGRYFDITRLNTSRQETKNNLSDAYLGVIAAESVRDILRVTLEESEIKHHFITDIEDCQQHDFSHALHVSCYHFAADTALLDALFDRDVPLFTARIGGATVHLGPLVLPNISASHHCVDAQLGKCIDEPVDDDVLSYWTLYALHEFMQIIMRISAETYINRVVKHYVDGSSRYPETLKVARFPGGAKSGLASKSALNLNGDAFYAWLHHSSVRVPHIDYLSPQNHQTHYSVQNLKSYVNPVPKLHSKEKILLPHSLTVSDVAPWVAANNSPEPLTIDTVAQLLKIAAGHQITEAGQVRRIAPTGGGLQSPTLVCVCRDITGLADGVYAFDGPTHTLERIEINDIYELRMCLDPYSSQAPLTIIAIGHLERVRNKYGDFGYNLVSLDAGVASCYALHVAKSFGWHVRAHTQFDSLHIAKLLRMPTTDYNQVLTTVMHFSAGDEPQEHYAEITNRNETTEGMVQLSRRLSPKSAAFLAPAHLTDASEHYLLGFLDTLLSRRAHQDFSTQAIRCDKLEALVAASYQHIDELQSIGALRFAITPWVILPAGNEQLTSGVYQTTRAGAQTWHNRSPDFSIAKMRDCINQSSFADSAAIVVFFADLEQALTQYGAAGYRQLLLQCGSLVAHSWLLSTAMGIVGSAAGGIIEAGLKVHANVDGYNESPMFSFAMGYPEIAEATEQPAANEGVQS